MISESHYDASNVSLLHGQKLKQHPHVILPFGYDIISQGTNLRSSQVSKKQSDQPVNLSIKQGNLKKHQIEIMVLSKVDPLNTAFPAESRPVP